ncbi:MAG: hypothetical protein OXF08_07775 [Bacteroidetes bacterium]|nr:hypothetical protein [Bacteroidota bacterium]
MPDSGSEFRRTELIDQMRYLIDEISALRQVISRMHEAQITNTDRGLSVKQYYGSIIMRDKNELLPALKKLQGTKKSRKARNKDWNRIPISEILTEVEKARQRVIQIALKLDLKDWMQEVSDGKNVYDLILTATHQDADALREIAQLLYRDHS